MGGTTSTLAPETEPPTRLRPMPEPAAVEMPCFSANGEISILGKGIATMNMLAVGDEVLTSSGNYKPVYMIDHFHPSKPTEFLQIQSTLDKHGPLELTPNHLLFLESKKYPVPATQIKIGDKVRSVEGVKEVIAVHKITREGLYNPITTDGTIVVNGLMASTFTSLSGETHVGIYDIDLLSMHNVLELASNPYGVLCTGLPFDLCNHHDELAGVSMAMRQLHNFWSEQNSFLKLLVVLIYLLLFGFLNAACYHYIIILGMIATWRLKINNKKKKVIA